MAVLYVDESGEEGFSPTSSEWFILGGAFQPSTALKPMIAAYDKFKATHCQPNWHFHFQNAPHDLRLGFIMAMRETGFRGFGIAIHKPSIRQRENFSKKYFLYFYALRFLLGARHHLLQGPLPGAAWRPPLEPARFVGQQPQCLSGSRPSQPIREAGQDAMGIPIASAHRYLPKQGLARVADG